MQIVNLVIDNFMRVEAVEITPGDRDTIVLTGANAQGKTSVLQAIWAALVTRAAPDEPVHQGADQAVVRLDLGEIVVTRSWSSEGAPSKLEVTTQAGAKIPSPARFLKEIVGEVAFDPLVFARLPKKEQRDMLLAMVDLPFDPDVLEKDRKRFYDERTNINRDLKALETQRAAMSPVPADTPDEEIDPVELLGKIQNSTQARSNFESFRTRSASISRQVEALLAEQTEIQNLARRIKESGALVEPDQIMEWTQQVADINVTNAHVRLQQQRNDLATQIHEKAALAAQLTRTITNLDEQKERGLAQAKLPVEGLSFDDEGVLLNGVPFSQASGAEKLKTSVALGMKASPKLRVMCVDEIGALDEASRATVLQMAKDHGYQLWVTTADTSGEIGITIEDGKVKS